MYDDDDAAADDDDDDDEDEHYDYHYHSLCWIHWTNPIDMGLFHMFDVTAMVAINPPQTNTSLNLCHR